MKKLNKVAMLFASAALATAAGAQTVDNWRNGTGELVWKNGTNELCWRDANWTPATAAAGCDGAITASGSGGRGPVGIAPAQFVGAVFPHQFASAVAPVVNGLGASSGCKSSRGKQHRHFIEFLHGLPHVRFKPQLRCEKSNVLMVLPVTFNPLCHRPQRGLSNPGQTPADAPEIWLTLLRQCHTPLTLKWAVYLRSTPFTHDPVRQRNAAHQP